MTHVLATGAKDRLLHANCPAKEPGKLALVVEATPRKWKTIAATQV